MGQSYTTSAAAAVESISQCCALAGFGFFFAGQIKPGVALSVFCFVCVLLQPWLVGKRLEVEKRALPPAFRAAVWNSLGSAVNIALVGLSAVGVLLAFFLGIKVILK